MQPSVSHRKGTEPVGSAVSAPEMMIGCDWSVLLPGGSRSTVIDSVNQEIGIDAERGSVARADARRDSLRSSGSGAAPVGVRGCEVDYIFPERKTLPLSPLAPSPLPILTFAVVPPALSLTPPHPLHQLSPSVPAALSFTNVLSLLQHPPFSHHPPIKT